jgi:acyl-coenzyme A thioesterase PaaI-like protein
MKLPYLVSPEKDLAHFSPITPRFPNWEKSFVSGPDSPLYQVAHFIHDTRKSLVLTRVNFLERALGPPGNVHGGATAGLLDELMGIAVWHQGEACVTQKLELHYGKLLPLYDEAMIYTEIVSTSVKTLEVHSTVYGKDELPHVTAQGIFHRLSAEQLEKFRALKK